MDKFVVAHFMVGNTYLYTKNEWRKNIELASDHGFDGFALNVGHEPWQFDHVADAFETAGELGQDFKLFISFDMASIPALSAHDIHTLTRYLTAFAHHPNYMHFRGGAIVSTFAGQDSLFGFGQGQLEEAWAYVKGELERAIRKKIHFVPSFFINPERYPTLDCIDGYYHWNGGWPIHLTPFSQRHEIHSPKLDSDAAHLRHLGGRTYMAAVSPWFFTHYGKDSWNKNWIYRGDDHLLVRRWEHLIAIRDQVDVVQLISWNDYGESHYVAPPLGAQPNSEAWVDPCPHDAWLSLNAYFIDAFKRGRYPHECAEHRLDTSRDVIWMWARPHMKDAVASNDNVERPNGWELTDNLFWVVVLAAGPSLLTISSVPSSTSTASHSHRRTYNLVTAGLHKFSHPMVENTSMRAEMIRDGNCVALCDPFEDSGFRFDASPKTYNFNAFVCRSR